MQHAAQRHRENFDDYKRDYERVRSNIDAAVQRSNLLGSVRKDIKWVGWECADASDYKTAMSSQTDALLADRGRIDSSHRMMDETLKWVKCNH